MSTERAETAREDSTGELEGSLIAEFLRARGHDPLDLTGLSPMDRDALLKDASVYASGRLAEIESKARFVHALHDGGHSPTKIGFD